MNAEPLLTTPIASRLGVILRGLAALIARRFLKNPIHAALTIPLWRHLTRAALRLDRIIARLAAGPLPPPKPRTPHKGGAHRKSDYPTTHAWLIRALGAEAAAYAAQLEALLAEPQAAVLLATPAARRTLAPIRRMLGLTPKRQRRPTEAPTKAPRRPPPARPAIPPHRSLDPLPARPRRAWWLPPPRLRSG